MRCSAVIYAGDAAHHGRYNGRQCIKPRVPAPKTRFAVLAGASSSERFCSDRLRASGQRNRNELGSVIALDDQALARLAIAATRVPERGRRRWLRRIARELEGHRPSAVALRVRKFRTRQRNGERVYRVVVDQVGLEELLIVAQTLSPSARDDHTAVEAALKRLLSILIVDHHGNAFPPGRGMYDTVRVGLCLSALRRKVSDGPPKRLPSR